MEKEISHKDWVESLPMTATTPKGRKYRYACVIQDCGDHVVEVRVGKAIDCYGVYSWSFGDMQDLGAKIDDAIDTMIEFINRHG